MRRIIVLILIFFFLFSSIKLADAAQGGIKFYPGVEVRFEHLSIDDGLSQNAGLSILQDRKGFLWIGTQDGLNRYDGVSILQFKNDPTNPYSISHNSVIALFEDTTGSIWIGTWGGGLNRYDPVSGKFTRYLADPKNPVTLSHPIVTSLAPASGGKLWVGTLAGLDLLDPATGQISHFPNDPTISGSNAISKIAPAADGSLFIGTGAFSTEGAGLFRFDPGTARFEPIGSNGRCLQGKNVSDILFDSTGRIWVSYGGYGMTGAGVDRFDLQTYECLHFDAALQSGQITDNNVNHLLLDRDGRVWAATWSNGLWRIDPESPDQIHVYRHNAANPESLSSDTVYSLYQDRSGIIWVGTLSSGINKLNLNTLLFRTYRHNPDDPTSIASNHVGSFAETPDGTIWVGTWETGLAKFVPETGAFTQYRTDPADLASLSSDLVMSLYGDPDGSLWVGTLGGGLNHFNPSTGQFKRLQHSESDSASLIDNQVTFIARDNDGRLWVTTMGGLDRLDPGASGFIHYPLNPETGFSAPPVTLFIDGADLWVGTWGAGAFRLDLSDPSSLNPETARFNFITHDPENANSLSSDSVWAIKKSKDGTLWFGTERGLNRFTPSTNRFKVYDDRTGFRNNTILGIQIDSQENLWCSTNNGLVRLNPADETLRVYDKSDGLQGNEFNSNASFTSPATGRMFFGGVNGFSVFDPIEILPQTTPPGVAITGFRVFNEAYPYNPNGTTPVELSYKQNFISFDFTALDFASPTRITFKYKLEGFDRDWVTAGNRRYASYTNLPGGKFTFMVSAMNADGISSLSSAVLPLVITPPLWQRWEFQAGLVVLLVALVAGSFQIRVRSVRENARQLERIVQQRTAEITDANAKLAVEVQHRKAAEAELAQRAEAELLESNERFRAAFESSAIGMALTQLDGRLLRANAALCNISGYSEEELMGMEGFKLVYPPDLEIGLQEFGEMMNGGRPSYQVEKRYIHKTGRVFWVRMSMSVMRRLDGSPTNLVTMVEDIDEQKRVQESLRESEARFRAILDNAAVGIAVMTLDRKIVQINSTAERIIGYSNAEITHIDPSTLAQEEDRNLDRDLFLDLIHGRRNQYTVEKRYYRKDGTRFWGRVNFSTVHTSEGRPLYLIGMIEDITEEKQAAVKLAAQEAEYRLTLETRIAERTDELNKANELLQQKAAQDAVAAERTRLARDLHDAVTQTLFSATLIADVLPDLWELNQFEARKRLEELRQLTRGALAEMRTLLVELRPNALVEVPLPILLRQLSDALTGRARIQIQLSVEGDRKLPPDVQVVLYRIAQEALNNVVKHARATQAFVSLRLGDQVRLSVTDNGSGFDPALVTADHLGLRIMRERADSIKASLNVYSEPEEGTQISIIWP